eukprot:6240539-Pyramimonas_sp.AAC.1
MTSGVNGRITVRSLVQLIGGIKHNVDQCARDRVGQAWVNDLYACAQTRRGGRPRFNCVPMDWCEKPFDPSTLKRRIVPGIPFNLRVPALTSPTTQAQHASVFMVQEVKQAGAPVDGSDGS